MVLLVLLLVCSAMISGSEVALFSLSASDLDGPATEKEPSKRLLIVRKLLEKPKRLLATILVANNFINIAIVLLFASLSDLFFSTIDTFFLGINVRFIIEVGVVTFLILLFGEILPKIYANRNNLAFSLFMSYPIRILDIILSPISNPMRKATLYVEKKFGKQRSKISVGHLSQALELTSEEETTHEEQKLLKGIVTFGNTDTKEVMKPRMDIFALQEDTDYKDIMPQIIANGYSRIPVFKESIDRITGSSTG